MSLADASAIQTRANVADVLRAVVEEVRGVEAAAAEPPADPVVPAATWQERLWTVLAGDAALSR